MHSNVHIIVLILSLVLLATSSPTSNPILVSRAECTNEVKDLVAGINKNIDAQKQEQSQTKKIQQQLSAGDVDGDTFQTNKDKLVSIVNNGITIRKANQKLVPDGNAAEAGLAKVADAQATELKMAKALTGKPDTDKDDLDTLQKMFAGGIKQNQQNAKDAAKGCTV